MKTVWDRRMHRGLAELAILLTIIALVVGTVSCSCERPTYESLDYFPIIPGYGIRYEVTDNSIDTPLSCYVWAVFQDFVTNMPDDPLEFVVTLVKDSTEQGEYYASCALGGETSHDWDNREFTCFYAGDPAGNQGNFYMNFCLLHTFRDGDGWTVGTRDYIVTSIGSKQIENGQSFDDCAAVAISDSSPGDSYLRGGGYFILAKDVGIVELFFKRDDGTEVLYDHVEHTPTTQLFQAHTISGKLSTSDAGNWPLDDVGVGLANSNWGTYEKVNPNDGEFSVEARGPDVVLRIWYDRNSDDVYDDQDWDVFPKEYCVYGVENDYTISDPIDINILPTYCPPGN